MSLSNFHFLCTVFFLFKYTGIKLSIFEDVGNCLSEYLPVCARSKSLSRVPLLATPWTVARQAPLFTGFSRQEYWSGLPFPSLLDLPNPGIEPWCLVLLALEGGFLKSPVAHLGCPFQTMGVGGGGREYLPFKYVTISCTHCYA